MFFVILQKNNRYVGAYNYFIHVFLTRRPGLHVGNLKLSINESIVSHVLHLAPEGTQFLKPVVLEVPHHAVMSDKSRELVVLRYVGSSSSWQEHTSTIIDDTERGSKFL